MRNNILALRLTYTNSNGKFELPNITAELGSKYADSVNEKSRVGGNRYHI